MHVYISNPNSRNLHQLIQTSEVECSISIMFMKANLDPMRRLTKNINLSGGVSNPQNLATNSEDHRAVKSTQE